MKPNMTDIIMKNINKAQRRIRNAGIAALCLVVLTVLQFLLPILGYSPATIVGLLIHSTREAAGTNNLHFASMPLYLLLYGINILIIIALLIGVFKKNELFSILLFSYSILALIVVSPTSLGLLGIPILLFGVIVVFLFWGVVGINDYHVLKNEANQ